MAGLNIVALISGGKDSIFSILHCRANGHDVVALANLYPLAQQEGDSIDDLESYMYQTIGHAVIPLYAQALGLPLYRQAISGTAINRDKNYALATDASANDETESLFKLLESIKQSVPHINAVSTGAILSDYQRTRVESVALRLGLVPLSYLWQWPSLPPKTQESLLEDMAAVGQDARIIKVASGGLDETFLWQNVTDQRMIARLAKAARRFGTGDDGAVLGEGGEYETLAIGGPAPLWKGRIEIASGNIEIVSGDAGSASVRIINPTFMPHGAVVPSSSDVRLPPLLEDEFVELRASMISEEHNVPQDNLEEVLKLTDTDESPDEGIVILDDISGIGDTVLEQTRSIMEAIISRLSVAGHTIDDIAYSIIVLRNMSDFGSVNEIYGSYFTKPNPPARVTIACAETLAPGALLSISITSGWGLRDGLHVQSRSYWAPANIGPYSQAIKFPTTSSCASLQASVFIAGQIPLVPATMELPISESSSVVDNFAEQASLSLQHLHRIGRVMGVKRWVFGIAFITANKDLVGAKPGRAELIRRAWKIWNLRKMSQESAEDEAEDFDIWDRKYGPASQPWRERSGEERNEWNEKAETFLPPLVVLQADSLPRGADVEWIGFGKTAGGSIASSVPPHLKGLLRKFCDSIKSGL